MTQELLIDPSRASSFSAISELAEPLNEALPPDTRWYVVGGLASAALRHSETIIESSGTIRTSYAADIPTVRPNGTVRDADILVDAVLTPEQMRHAKRTAEQIIDGRLEVSLFGFDDATDHEQDKLSFLSRRVIDEQGQRYHQLGPIRQAVSAESYEQWHLVLPNGSEVPVLHPIGHVLAYRGRSISGLRPKDTTKFYDMVYKIFDHQDQDFSTELHHGLFADWHRFTTTIAKVRNGEQPPVDMVREGTSKAELTAMRWQGRLLRMLENNTMVVDIAQSNTMQRILSTFVRAA